MAVCRTIDEIWAAADAESLDEPVRSQEWADRIALILASSRYGHRTNAQEPPPQGDGGS